MKTIQVSSAPEPWLVLLAMVAGVIFFWLLMRLVVRLVTRRRTGLACRWSRHRAKDGEVLQAWSCKTCAEVAYSATGKPPEQCKRGLSPRAL